MQQPAASTGSHITTLHRPLARVCCGRVSRGLAIAGDTLFLGTIDAQLIAIDTERQARLECSGGQSGAGLLHHILPLVVKDKVIIGVAAARYGIQSSSRPTMLKLGRRAWKFLPFPDPANRDTRPGRAIPGRQAGRLGDRFL